MILYGLETEYGISREQPSDDHDVVAESIALVRTAQESGVRMRWDYACEDPHVDARGFRVDALRQDTDEANYFAQDAARPLSFSEIKSDLVLKNGARFYNDHAHPEYCTPECSSIADLLKQDLLGDRLVMKCAQELSEKTADKGEGHVLIYKNNTDFLGHSYGTHENYLIPRSLAWPRISEGMLAFLVTRQILCGAGKFGWESEDAYEQPGFQISQRADFFSVLESVDTMQLRPIINTRDEPHADPEQWRRFHVIVGDANLSPYSTYLKVGTTAAVLAALSQTDPALIPKLQDPVNAMRAISRDPSWKWPLTLADGRPSTAIEVQHTYLELVRESLPEPSDGFDLSCWESTLNDLERDPLSTSDRLDWSAKHQLLTQFRAAEGVDEADPWMMSLDLAYHLLNENEGLYFGLREQNHFLHPPCLLDAHASSEPTRAAVRGRCIEKFGSAIIAAQWDHVILRDSTGTVKLGLQSLFDPQAIAEALTLIDAASKVSDLQGLTIAGRPNTYSVFDNIVPATSCKPNGTEIR